MHDEINKKYEAKHLAKIQADQKKIEILYRKSIEDIYRKAGKLKAKGNTFSISDFPEFNKHVDQVLFKFSQDTELTLNNGIKGQWELSNEKNAAIIHKNYSGIKILEQVDRMIYDPQSAALDQFLKKKTAGLVLSDRVLKYTSQLQGQIEQNLYAGISEGKGAAAMARDQVAYMENPEPLFRRVRDAKGTLRLSSNAKKYYDKLGAPGQGVYRSPYKNFMRMTRTITNDSYRESDMARYQSMPFILGYQVNLSNNHKTFDICDDLKGTYPKTFVWLKWHVQCVCNCTSKLASPEEFEKYQEAVLNGTEANFKFSGVIKDMPSHFDAYVDKNKGSMDGWARKPDWVTNNEIKI
jgi:hypothetical protein